MIKISSSDWIKLDYGDEVIMDPGYHYLIIENDVHDKLRVSLHSDIVRRSDYEGQDCITSLRCYNEWYDTPINIYTRNNKWSYGKCLIRKIDLPAQYYDNIL